MPSSSFRWPTPANLRPQSAPAAAAVPDVTSAPASAANAPAKSTASAATLPQLLGCETFRLDSDLKLALQDMQATSGVGWPQWLGQMVNDALRHYLGQ